MYKQASQLKLRFTTSRGNLSVEQLWDLSLNMLRSIIENQYTQIAKTGNNLDFLDEKTVDPIDELKFNILKDIYVTKKQEIADAKKAAEKKANNQKIMEIIARKEDEALNGKSIEELRKMLND